MNEERTLYSGSTVPLASLTRELFAKVAAETPNQDLTAIVNAYPGRLNHESTSQAAARHQRSSHHSGRLRRFTKGGLIADPAKPFEEPQGNLRPESIRKEVEASLRRLGVERIDLYQFHWPDELGAPVEESWGEMAHLIEEGKVRAGGVSNYDVDMLERAERVRHVDSLQPPFSLIRRQAGADVDGWIAAGNLTLDATDLAEIAGAVEHAGAGPQQRSTQ